jgi:hypothetical protein
MKYSGSQTSVDVDEDDDEEYTLTRENILKFGKDALSYFKIVPKPTFLYDLREHLRRSFSNKKNLKSILIKNRIVGQRAANYAA